MEAFEQELENTSANKKSKSKCEPPSSLLLLLLLAAPRSKQCCRLLIFVRRFRNLRDKFEKLQHSVERHKWHVGKLELMGKSLRNDRVNVGEARYAFSLLFRPSYRDCFFSSSSSCQTSKKTSTCMWSRTKRQTFSKTSFSTTTSI